MKICFDMDGTIADLYAVENWLPLLRSHSTKPYEEAKPMLHFSTLARLLNNQRKAGNQVCIISWTSKDPSAEYHEAVAQAKREWLKKHLPSVHFDEIYIIPYGEPKENYADPGDILFDDVAEIREAWGNGAYAPESIISILRKGGI